MAACINTAVGATAFLYGRGERRKHETDEMAVPPAAETSTQTLSLGVATVIAGLAGFIALGFEIAWFRVFALATFDRAPAFALLLSTYLAGVAAGSFLSEKLIEKKKVNAVFLAGTLILAAGAVSVYLPPLMALLCSKGISVMASTPGFFVTAGLLGSVLPLLCQASVAADESAGRRVSLIYLSNIIGSTAGSLMIGFVLMNYFGTEAISMQLAAACLVTGSMVLLFHTGRLQVPPVSALARIAVTAVAIPAAAPAYANLFGKLIFAARAVETGPMKHLVENRNGIVAVTANDAVFGGGVYDGFVNIDPANDKNLVIRAYALSLFQPQPKHAFMLGLASGSWAQIVANNPEVEDLDIVEINPGYFQLIAQYPEVRSVLHNPKVHFYVDDARRWLLAHPEKKYDAMVANTSFHWRDHSSQILSSEYLAIVKSHLRPGGSYYYNTTESDDVLATGLHGFGYGLRVISFLAVSDSPFVLDKDRWLSVLGQYTIDGKRMFDPADPRTATILAAYSQFADTVKQPPRLLGLESGDALAQRLGPRHIITDDNMGAEWTEVPKPPWR
jgi:predicted membrane-bound spermidine synthase